MAADGNDSYQDLNNPNTGIEMTVPAGEPTSDAPVATNDVFAAISPSAVTINTNGPFMRRISTDGHSLPSFGGYRAGSFRARVLQLLHEVGHLVITGTSLAYKEITVGKGKNKQKRHLPYRSLNSLLPADKDKPSLSMENTDKVFSACHSRIEELVPR